MKAMWLLLTPLLLHWGISALSIWIAGQVFRGLKFADGASVLAAGLVLAVANAVIKPLVVLLTLPLTFLTLGLFLLVINAGMLLLVSRLVKGFYCDGFWTAFWASLLIGVLSLVLESWLASPQHGVVPQMPHSGLWL